MWHLTRNEIVETVIQAEKDGYDAVVVLCNMDIGVPEARSMVDIPVLGPGEVTMTYATLLGAKFGINDKADQRTGFGKQGYIEPAGEASSVNETGDGCRHAGSKCKSFG